MASAKRRLWIAAMITSTVAAVAATGVFVTAEVARTAYATGRYEQAATVGTVLRDLPLTDSGHALFLTGTSRAAAGDLESAEMLLMQALSATAAADDCGVRFNLALVLEAIGDTQTQGEPAAVYFERASQAARGAHADCRLRPFGEQADAGPVTASAGELLDQVEARNAVKHEEMVTASEHAQPAEEPAEAAQEEPAEQPPATDEELRHRLEAGLRAHADAVQDHNARAQSGAEDAPVDRPW